MNQDEVIDQAFATVARITGRTVDALWAMATTDRADYPSQVV